MLSSSSSWFRVYINRSGSESEIPEVVAGVPQSNGKHHEDGSRGLDEHHWNAERPYEFQTVRMGDLGRIL